MPILFVCGDFLSTSYQLAKGTAEDLVHPDASEGSARLAPVGLELELRPLVEAEWRAALPHLQRQSGGRAFAHPPTEAFVTHSTLGYLGGVDDLIRWAVETHRYVDRISPAERALMLPELRSQAEHELATYIARHPQHTYTFFEFKLPPLSAASSTAASAGVVEAKDEKGEPIHSGRVVFELYRTQCKRTVDNFVGLCEGTHQSTIDSKRNLHYTGSCVHRVVRDGWIQGGDIVTGKGTGGESIFGATFADECLTVPHDHAGVLAMANNGPHTNASQWFVAMRPLPSLQGKKVAFGRVLCGMSAFHRINECDTRNERPRGEPITITRSGEFHPVSGSDAGVAAWTKTAGGRQARAAVRQALLDAERATLHSSGGDGKRARAEPTKRATLLLVGLDFAGKTTIMNHLIGNPADHVLPTIGFEPADCVHDDYRLQLWGVSGDEKLRALWQGYYGGAHGFVFVIDTSDQKREDVVAQAFADFAKHEHVKGKPILVFANKQDKESAASAAHVQWKLGLDSAGASFTSPVRTQRVVALVDDTAQHSEPDENISKGLGWLLSQITAQYGSLCERVTRDEAARKEAEKAKREARRKEMADAAAAAGVSPPAASP